MLKLIKNEIYKVFHKKSTYIFLVVTILYALLTNYIYSTDLMSGGYDYYYEDTYSDDYIASLEPDSDELLQYKANQEVKNMSEKYGKDSWQYKVIREKYYNIAYNYYMSTKNEYNTTEAKNAYEEAKKALESDNWEYFVNLEIKETNENIAYLKSSLNNASTKEKESINIDLFVQAEKLNNLNYRLKEKVPYGNDYLNKAISIIDETAYSVATYNNLTDEKEKKNYEDDVKTYYESKYVLDKKEDTINEGTTRGVFINFFNEYSFIILIFTIMIAGSIVSDEFNKGTIKSLLITPYRRGKILLSKFITVMIMIPFIVLFITILEFLIGGIFLGFDSLKIPVVIYNLSTKSLEIVNLFKYVLIMFGANLPKIILLATLSFAVSTILTNTAFAITITFCGMIGSEIINMAALNPKLNFLNYFVTTNWDFTQYLWGGKSMFGNSLPHAIIVCLVYFVIMAVVSLIVFKKKDIKNI